MLSNVLYFPGRAVDIVSHHHIHGHWSSNGEVTQGGGIRYTRFQKAWPA